MGWFKQLSLSWIILSVVAACVSCQELISTLREGNSACSGDEVIFTCTVRGPSNLSVIAIAWSSPEYIGSSLQLSTANMIGHIETSTMDGNITAIAMVTNNTNINGELILESTLRITAVEASMVTCTDPNQGPESIEFTVSAVPGVPMDITASEISQSPENNICVILVTWAPPTNSDMSDIARYRVYVPSRNINVTVSSAPPPVTTLRVPNCGDDIRVQVAAVNRVGCVGMNSSEQQLPILRPTVNVSATTEGGSTSTPSQLGVGAIVGITIAVILPTVCFLGLLFVGICYVCVAGKSTEMLLHEMSMTRQVEFHKYLVDFYIAFKKDFTKDKLSSVKNLSQMMENRILTKRYIKEAVKSALETIKLEHGEDVKEVLVYLKKNVPKVLESFDNELEDKDTDITMANLIRAAEQNVHAEVFNELMKIMGNTKPEIVERLLRTMFEELQTRLPSEVSPVEMQENLVDFYIAVKKDLTEDKLSSVERLSQIMENQTLSKQYIKEAVRVALETIKLEHGEDVKKVLVYLKNNVPEVLSSFDNKLEDKDPDITMANLIRAAEQNVHERDFDKLIEIMDNTEPEIVQGLLWKMFEELQTRLQSEASSVKMKWVTNPLGRTSYPNSEDDISMEPISRLEEVNTEFPTQ